ncbi:MAG: alanine racemase [Rhodospirillales bacterium]
MSASATTAPSAAAVLSVDLGAIAANYRRLRDYVAPAECAAVVKADAYGLGVAQVAPALARAGALSFFVAQGPEGAALRRVLPKIASIYVLNGLMDHDRQAFEAERLAPVLNDLGQIERWSQYCRARGARLPAALHIDTGMNRLGLPSVELARLAREPQLLAGIGLELVMSHLACADEPDHRLNRRQRDAFRAALTLVPGVRASLAASSGIFLGRDFHFDLARPGVALYGANPLPGKPNPMAQVVGLKARILQVRDVDRGETVGYGAAHRFIRRRRIATVGVGYADGFLRSLSNRGCAMLGGVPAPIVGRVSMDLITLDVSDAPGALQRAGETVELIGPGRTIDDVAAEAGTIAYEILTSLGPRYERRYSGEPGSEAQ